MRRLRRRSTAATALATPRRRRRDSREKVELVETVPYFTSLNSRSCRPKVELVETVPGPEFARAARREHADSLSFIHILFGNCRVQRLREQTGREGSGRRQRTARDSHRARQERSRSEDGQRQRAVAASVHERLEQDVLGSARATGVCEDRTSSLQGAAYRGELRLRDRRAR